MKPSAAVIVLFGILIAASGCLQQIGVGTSYRDAYIDGLSPVAISDPSYYGKCELGTCWCMVCRNGTNLFGPMKNLIGGNCYWNTECNVTTYANLNNKTKNPGLSTRQFMLGQGTTFSDFANANTYCGDQLTMAVQWLPAIGSAPYLKPDTLRTMCMLSKEIMPVYVLYSGGRNINPTRAAQIGLQMATEGDDFFRARLSDGPVGPVIIVIEPDIDQSKVPQVRDAVIALDSKCNPNRFTTGNITCFIAVSPKLNDFDTMKALLEDPDTAKRVDLIAFGINGSSVHGCEDAKMQMQVAHFAGTALHNYSKPTIIPYVLFDVGTKDADQACTWDESRVAAAYGSFFPGNIQALQSRGVIGIAPYSFNVSTSSPVLNPLNCTDCGIATNENRLKNWYGGCEAYAITRNSSGGIIRHGSMPIRFPNATGGSCSETSNVDYFFNFNFRDKNFMRPELPGAPQALNKSFACDACLIQNSSRSLTDMFDISVGKKASVSKADCEPFASQIDTWAGARNLDPLLVRAIILGESQFNESAASRSCNPNYDGSKDGVYPSCFPTGEGYKKGLDAMYDPAHKADYPSSPSNDKKLADWRWIAYGLMQSLEPPYTFWPASLSPTGEDGQYYFIFQKSKRNTPEFVNNELTWAKDCNDHFNPFNASDSICMGTLKFQNMLDNATAEVAAYHAKGWLNWPSSDEEKDRVFATYIALNKYGGFWDLGGTKNPEARCDGATNQLNPPCSSDETNGECWVRAFHESWTHNDSWCEKNSDDPYYEDYCNKDKAIKKQPPFPAREDAGCPPLSQEYYCYGYTDFVKFVHDCEVPFIPRKTDPGANKLNIYMALSKECDSFCPEGNLLLKKLLEGSGKLFPASGTPYLPDSITTTTTTTGTTTGTGSTSGTSTGSSGTSGGTTSGTTTTGTGSTGGTTPQ